MNKIRKNINKRIKSTSLYQERHFSRTAASRHHDIDKGLTEDEGSRSLAVCSHVSAKITTSDEALKIQKKRKRRKKNKHNTIQDKESSPIHSLTTVEENIPCVVDSYKTHKPKVWSV